MVKTTCGFPQEGKASNEKGITMRKKHEPEERYAIYMTYAIMVIGAAGVGFAIFKLFGG
jgi:hypothetical protein